MPRQARLDAAGTLHHVILREVNRDRQIMQIKIDSPFLFIYFVFV